MVPTNAHQCSVLFDGKHVYSNAKFHCGDIIEICPTAKITKNALYAREVRDLAFEVEPDELFVIPMGYCQHYDIIGNQYSEPNCDWEWNGDDSTIVIRAMSTIPQNSVLILNLEK